MKSGARRGYTNPAGKAVGATVFSELELKGEPVASYE
jgi:hypothetical protein